MPGYSDTVDIAKGITMTFEPNLRRVVVKGDPDDDEFFVPAHWHGDHNEIITVLEGRLQVTLGSEMKIYTPESGAAFIPRGIAHSLRGFKGERCVVTEETNPTEYNDTKELFFRNLFAIPEWMTRGSLLGIMQVFYHGDGYPVFPVHIKWLEKAFVVILGYYIAPLFGYRLKYESLKRT